MTLIHITKRALAVVGGRDQEREPVEQIACTYQYYDPVKLLGLAREIVTAGWVKRNANDARASVTCPACLVLLDAELEGRGVEAQRQRAEIEAAK